MVLRLLIYNHDSRKCINTEQNPNLSVLKSSNFVIEIKSRQKLSLKKLDILGSNVGIKLKLKFRVHVEILRF